MTTGLQQVDDPSPDWLDQALARSLPAPVLPAGLQSRLQALARHDALLDLQRRHGELEAELVQARRRLRHDQLPGSLQMLGAAVVASFACGAAVSWTATLWLPWLGEGAAAAMPALSLGLGFAAGAVALARGRWRAEGP